MHCASCAILIDRLISKQDGVIKASTSFGAERLVVEYDPEKIKPERFSELVASLGYSAKVPTDIEAMEKEETEERAKILNELKKTVIVSFLIASPIIAYYMLIHMFNVKHIHEFFDFVTIAKPLILTGEGIRAWGEAIANYGFWMVAQPMRRKATRC